MTLDEMKSKGEAAEWMTEESYQTISNGYLQPNETPRQAYERVAYHISNALNKPEMQSTFFDIMWKNWFCPSSPVLSNTGTKNLPISCYAGQPAEDSTFELFNHNTEMGMLTKFGGGVGSYFGNVRSKGHKISSGGTTDGIIPFLKMLETTVDGTKQGASRRGSVASYLPFEHGDIEEFINVRNPKGDLNRKCLTTSFHNAVTINNDTMNAIINGDKHYRKLWQELMTQRVETGEPYILYRDNFNKNCPSNYMGKLEHSNLCLHEDTLVATKEYGPIKIKDLVGKTVTIFDGKEWVSNSNFRKTGERKKLKRITLSNGTTIDCTPEHRWFGLREGKRLSEYKVREYKTSELTVGTTLEAYYEFYSEGKIKPTAAYAKGFLLAEGTRTPISSNKEDYKPLLWLYEPKKMVYNRLRSSLQEEPISDNLRSDHITEINLKPSGENRYVIQGLGSRRSLLPWCTSYKQNFPQEIFNWTVDSKLEFLAGLFDGDGTYMTTNGGYQIASIHKDFLLGLQALLSSLNITSTINIMRKKGLSDFNDGYGKYETNDAYRLTISAFFGKRFSDLVKFERLPQYMNKEPNRFCSGQTKVISIEDLDGEYDTYCTTVPSTTKFGLANGLMTGNCSEIALPTSSTETFVCCLSSLNLDRYREWENWKSPEGYTLVQLSIMMLDGVITLFVNQAKNMQGLSKAVRFAERHRALGLGVLGWHSLLQKEMIPFASFKAMMLNNEIFSKMRKEADEMTKILAKEYGECEETLGTGRRNTVTLAVAPTMSNSILSGGVSQGIEPITANLFVQKSAKGNFIRRNKYLERLLESKGLNTFEVWDQINKDMGSVRNLKQLSDEEKSVFLTAREIDQYAIIQQASQRQKYIDQAQSINLFFALPKSKEDQLKVAKYINEVHLEAWKLGVKSLYYLKTASPIKGQNLIVDKESSCLSCEG